MQIMVPMIRRGHWTLYAIHFHLRCIDILDANPYGPALGGISWKEYHNEQVNYNGRKILWSRLIMTRLSMSL
jgi:hypothetical protein